MVFVKSGGKKIGFAVAAVLCVAAVAAAVFMLTGKNGNGSDNGGFEAYCKEITSENIAQEDGVYYSDSSVLLTAEEGVSFEQISKLAAEVGGEISGYISSTNDYQIFFSEKKTFEELKAAAAQLKEKSGVEYASPEYASQIDSSKVNYTSDPWIDANKDSDNTGRDWEEDKPSGSNWWAEAIGMPSVWNMDLNTETVKVGVIDTCFDTTNEDLDQGIFAKTWNNSEDGQGNCNVTELYSDKISQSNNAENQNDKNELLNEANSIAHGTHVCGIIAAQGGNGFGITGINQNVQLYGYSMNGERETVKWGTSFSLKCALATVLNENVKVINFSMGLTNMLIESQSGNESMKNALDESSSAMSSFLQKYIDKGQEFLICAAAGNESDADKKYDAGYDILSNIKDKNVSDRIMIVGAAELQDGYYTIADFSNTGNRVDVYAPGVDILSDFPTNITANMSGTSMASPIVSGIASLVWGVNPNLSAEQVKSIVMASTYSTIFDLDGKWAIERDWINLVSDPTPIVNAKIAVEMAEQAKGAGDSKEDFGTVSGMIYSLKGEDVEYDVNVKSINVYDENGNSAGEVTPETYTNYALDDDGSYVYIQLMSYSVLLKPGSYSIEIDTENYGKLSRSFSLENNENKILHFEFVDPAYLVTDAYNENLFGREVAIPKINISSDTVKNINEEIWQKIYVDTVERELESWEMNPGVADYIKYKWALNGDTISLVIESKPEDWAWWDFYVYNVSASSGEVVKDEDIVSQAGFTWDEYQQKIRDAAGSYFSEGYSLNSDNFKNQQFVDIYNSVIDNTLSQENIDKAVPYINSEGQLCVIVPVYSVAGASFYYRDLNLEDFVYYPDYDKKAVLITG